MTLCIGVRSIEVLTNIYMKLKSFIGIQLCIIKYNIINMQTIVSMMSHLNIFS